MGMPLSSVVVGRKYWFMWARDTELGKCIAVGNDGAVFVICRGVMRDHAHACRSADIIAEDGANSAVVVPTSLSDSEGQQISVGPRRINLSDGGPAVKERTTLKRWWEIWK